ncbi:hypothetical protein ABPG72_013716 [Tetrahymena utriculariae]
MDFKKTEDWVNNKWDHDIQPVLEEYIRIPNQSHGFDPKWNENGLLEKAANLLLEWAKKQEIKGAKYELIKDEDKSPLIYIEVDGSTDDTQTVLFYGHYDKQPPFTGWLEGLAFDKPVVSGDKLYGRGGADDGYSIFGSLAAIKICQEQGLPHPRCIVLIEGDEESGSAHLTPYLDKLRDRIREPAVVFCLDSGCLNYEQLWMTTSLRGCLTAIVKVKVLNEGVHSGDASGIVPSSFRVLRQLLSRIENAETGELVDDFQVVIPADRYVEALQVSHQMGEPLLQRFPLAKGVQTVTKNVFNGYVNSTWKATLCVVGADGLPAASSAGNVLRPETTVKISIRLPPTLDVETAKHTLQKLLTENVPYGAEVTLENIVGMPGWNCPHTEQYLLDSIQKASKIFYQKEALSQGMGGTIPLMGTLSRLFPKSQFIITGILGPGSNAHGPNEFLHIPFTKKLICCMASVLADTYAHLKKN